MSTTDRDERPLALREAEAASESWSAAARHQQRTTPNHVDFYALAGEMVTTLYALDDLTGLLAAQVGGYGQGRALYDDTRTVDPAHRLSEAVACLRDVRAGLRTATTAANAFWNAIGHIGVDTDGHDEVRP